jgi:hypothetical protein
LTTSDVFASVTSPSDRARLIAASEVSRRSDADGFQVTLAIAQGGGKAVWPGVLTCA